MITHLSLENWKAYRNLDLTFDDGATFVIARNGIGKTSLVQGAMWAVFGDLAGIDPSSCVRAGADATNATVDLSLNGEPVRISRSFSVETGRTEAAITFEGRTTAGAETVERYLSQGLGAEPSLIARMCFLREGEAVAGDDTAAVDLRSHLARVFGVEALLSLAADEDGRRRRLARLAQDTRRTQRLADSDRVQLMEHLRQLEAALAEVHAEQEAARVALNAAQRAVTTLTSWTDYETARKRQEAERQSLVNRISIDLGLSDASEDNILPRLTAERNEWEARLQNLSREQGSVDAERAILANFSSSLTAGTETCPVCRRSISPEERQHAQRSHADQISQLEQRAAGLSEEVQGARAQLVELDRWINELNKTAGWPVAPSTPRPDSWREDALESAQEALTLARESLEAVTTRVGRAEEERRALQNDLDRDAEAATRSAELFRRYREEALSELVSTTLRQSADEVCARQIDPLATEIQSRWKLLWPNRAPIRLLANGRLVAARAGREVPYNEFSGGEKVVSTVILRLLALSMTTNAPFLWLDEPLEHLDPRNRRMVASLLVTASRGEKTKQIVATTYEEAVARRLDETNAAHLVYVEAEPEE